MTIPTTPLDPEKQPALTRMDSYADWRNREGVPLVGGVYIEDMKAVEVGPWPRKGDGVKGALCYLDGDNGGDEHIVELAPGGYTAPLRHMYTEAIYVVSGHGSCSVWREGGEKQTFEWGPGQLLRAPPPTPGISSSTPACRSRRGGSQSPTCLQLFRQWNSEHFIFDNDYNFDDRYQGEPDYFNAEAKLYRGRVWETNFIPDIRKLPLYEWKSRGGGGTNAFMVMGSGLMESHVSRFESGYYYRSPTATARARTSTSSRARATCSPSGATRSASAATGRKAASTSPAPGRACGCTSTSTWARRRPPTW